MAYVLHVSGCECFRKEFEDYESANKALDELIKRYEGHGFTASKIADRVRLRKLLFDDVYALTQAQINERRLS